MGLELAEQLGWRLPDAIVYPTGGGTGIVGMWKAFAELEALGLHRARAAADGRRPGRGLRADRARVRARRAPRRALGGRGDARRRPARAGRDRRHLILDALRASGGTAVAVSEDALTEAQLLAGRLMGAYVAPETGAAFAAVRALRERGDARRAEQRGRVRLRDRAEVPAAGGLGCRRAGVDAGRLRLGRGARVATALRLESAARLWRCRWEGRREPPARPQGGTEPLKARHP